MAIIRQVMPIKAPEIKAVRVAAYARVSSGKEAMLHSLSTQVSYFSEYIQNHPGWQFAGVYADEAKSGTKDNRPTVLVPIKGTEHDGLCEARQVHSDCYEQIRDLVEGKR